MPNGEHSGWEINAHEPDHYNEKSRRFIWLAFEGTAENPRFGFTSSLLDPNDPRDFRPEIDRAALRFFSNIDDFREAFYETIFIEEDTFIEVATWGDHFFFSKKISAIKTAESRARLYGDLKYWNSEKSKWQERVMHSESTCNLVSFKAKYNDGIDPETRHKFSYNVRVRNNNDHMVEYEIDPDIQNPKARRHKAP